MVNLFIGVVLGSVFTFIAIVVAACLPGRHPTCGRCGAPSGTCPHYVGN